MGVKLLTRVEAAEYIGVSKSWLSEQAKHGTGPSFLKIGGKVRYLQESLDAYLMASVVHTTTSATKPAAKPAKSKREAPVVLTQEDIDLALQLKKAGKLK